MTSQVTQPSSWLTYIHYSKTSIGTYSLVPLQVMMVAVAAAVAWLAVSVAAVVVILQVPFS
jgi:hypothetical protein